MRCKGPHHWSSSQVEGIRKTLCGILLKQDIERGPEKFHYHREGAAGSGLCFGQVPSLFGWVRHNHINRTFSFEVPVDQTEC